MREQADKAAEAELKAEQQNASEAQANVRLAATSDGMYAPAGSGGGSRHSRVPSGVPSSSDATSESSKALTFESSG